MKTNLTITGMHCVSCARRVENALRALPGVTDAAVNAADGTANVSFDPSRVKDGDFDRVVAEAGYKVVRAAPAVQQSDAEESARHEEQVDLKRRFIVAVGFGVALMYIAMSHHAGLPFPFLSSRAMAVLQWFLATTVVVAGSAFYRRGIISFIKTRMASMDTLIAIGTGTAYLYSMFVTVRIFQGAPGFGPDQLYYETAAMIIAFILLGNWMGAAARGRTSAAIRALAKLQPVTAWILRDGNPVETAVADIVPGDMILVKPGQRIPVDGTVRDGYSAVDESMITGESIPVEKKTEDSVIGGTLNTNGSFTFIARHTGADTMLSHIIEMVHRAQMSQAPVQRLADRVAAWFVPVVMAIALAAGAFWLWYTGDMGFALTALIAVLIIACPCSLGLATPTAIMVATGVAARHGILIRNADAVQKAGSVDTVVFDKTGTLTVGKPKLTDFRVAEGEDPLRVLGVFAAVEERSEHTLARAVRAYAEEKGVRRVPVEEFRIVPGKGVVARSEERDIVIGKREFLEEEGVSIDPALAAESERLAHEGKTLVWIAEQKINVGCAAIADPVKESALRAVEKLKRAGIKIFMITGDSRATAMAIARETGIDAVMPEVLPQDKAAEIQMLKDKGYRVAMVGDGINDAPALATADVGIAIGSGTDVAIESAAIVLVRNDVTDVVVAMELSRRTMRTIRQNLFWAFFYNIVGLPIAAGALYPFTGYLLSPIIAAAAMAFSSVTVVTNSLLIRRFRVE